MNGGDGSRRWAGIAVSTLPAGTIVALAVAGRLTDTGAAIEPGAMVSLAAAALIVVLVSASAFLRRALQASTIAAVVVLLVDAGWRSVDVFAGAVGLIVIAVVVDRLGAELEVLRAQHEGDRRQLERRVALLTAVEALPDTQDEAIAEVVSTLRSLAFDMAGVSLVRDGMLIGALLDGVDDLPPLPPGRGLAWRSILEDRTVTTLDYSVEPDRLDERPGVGSVVVSPIRVDDRPVGALIGARFSGAGLTYADIEVAEVLAAHLSSVLTALERERRQAELLSRAARLDELRSSLIAAVSEEVRTPIAAVAAAAERLRPAAATADVADDHTVAALAHLRTSAAELHTTVTTVLAVSRRRLTGDVGEFEVLTLAALVTAITGAPVEDRTHVPPGAGSRAAGEPPPDLDVSDWERRVEVVPGLVTHAVELLIGEVAMGRLTAEDLRVAVLGEDVTLTIHRGALATPSPVIRSLAAQLLAAAGAELVGTNGVSIWLRPVPIGQLG